MNPTDLRTELAARAGDSDRHDHRDLLPGVRRRIRTTKRRRLAAGLTATAAVVVLAIGVVPSLVTTAEPDPATTPTPKDVVSGDIAFPGLLDGQPLQAAAIGAAGQNDVTFSWTPDKPSVDVRTVCSSGTDNRVRVTIDDLEVAEHPCAPGADSPGDPSTLSGNAAIWSRLHAGIPVQVKLTLTDDDGKAITDRTAILAAGIYHAADRPPAEAMPSQQPPTGPDDYVKDGVRFRSTVAADTLLGATIAEAGSDEAELTFTPSGSALRVSTLCQGNSDYAFTVTLNGKLLIDGTCNDTGDDPGAGGVTGDRNGLRDIEPGQPNVLRLKLTDRNDKPVTPPASTRIGLGVYQLGNRSAVTAGRSGTVDLPTVREYLGYRYDFYSARAGQLNSNKSIRISTPADTPFIVVYGTTETEQNAARLRLDGVDGAPEVSGIGGGETEAGQPSRAAGTATLRLVEGDLAKGTLYLAIYTPE